MPTFFFGEIGTFFRGKIGIPLESKKMSITPLPSIPAGLIPDPQIKRPLNVIMMLGLPGSGKTTLAKEIVEKTPMMVRINKDDIRAMLGGPYGPQKEELVREVWNITMFSSLASGYSVVIDDAGNLNPQTRAKIFSAMQALGVDIDREIEVYINSECLAVPIDECIKRDLKRADSVGADVIQKMADRFLPHPQYPMPEHYDLPSAIVVDIDGTLSMGSDRSPYDYAAAIDDKVSPEIAQLIRLYLDVQNNVVIYITEREESSRKSLEKWLEKNGLTSPGPIHMRPDGDRRSSVDFKKETLEGIIKNWRIEYLMDNDPSVIKMVKRLGVKTLEVSI